ncbi:glycerophosphodiester phosphodiesterase family protein [Pasteurella multocida]|uniref:glycerophosphodiester phosphodiesterase family protein n=1 Tax=Pasteurella multocida TaxID=747 RepID=UPI00189C1259|nr:glycerophosphodiester phosphodiesterase family protein [Pasteurella multocida]MBF6981242.1 glycerophosphodiester phosphodiesterase family protein [Pasteurella multocida]
MRKIILIFLLLVINILHAKEGNNQETLEKLFPINTTISNCKPWSYRYKQFQDSATKNIIITARHRGDFDLETPENSLGAFFNSYQKCRPSIETDLRLTKDGHVVLFHDLNVGKMTNPNYDPENDIGENLPLKSLTLDEIKKLNLVTIDRKKTIWKIPTLEEFLEHYINNDPGSLVFLEVKDAAAMHTVIDTVKRYDRQYLDKNLRNRIIIKFNIALYPTPEQWIQASRIEPHSNQSLMANPIMPFYAAESLNKEPPLPDPEHKYQTNAERSVYLWSKADFHTAPVIEIVLKDSTEFINKQNKENAFGKFEVPTSLEEKNAQNGSLAKMVTIVKANKKALGVFVPIPDYNMWRTNLVTGYTVNNTFGNKEPILVDNAFFNNTSSCCYSLKDRRHSSSVSKELHDWRMNLEWQKSIGATVYTADDTDSINVYFNTEEKWRPSPYMNSILSWILNYVTYPSGSIVNMQAWNGEDAYWPWGWSLTIGSKICLYLQTTTTSAYGLVEVCGDRAAMASGYNPYITLRKSPLYEDKMQIYNNESNKCLLIPTNTRDWATMESCNDVRTAQIVRYPDNRYKNSMGGLYMTFKFYGQWYAMSYGYAYSVPHEEAIKDSWSKWSIVPIKK